MLSATSIIPVFDELRTLSDMDIKVSTLGVNIDDALRGDIHGYYGFYKGGAVRLDVDAADNILQICIWKSPGDLNQPDIKIDALDANLEELLPIVAEAMKGKLLEESFIRAEGLLLMTEGAKEDITEFLSQIPNSDQRKISSLYKDYLIWAGGSDKGPVSQVYFYSIVRNLREFPQLMSPKNSFNQLETPEETIVEPREEDIFINDVMDNEVYYKAAMFESILKRMARGDPGIVSLFVYGGPGLGKSFTAKKILKAEGVWDTKVVYKSGSIAGFTGLLQLLWENRKDKIIVLDDNDSILVGNIAAANILKAALNTEPDDRVISYIKYKG